MSFILDSILHPHPEIKENLSLKGPVDIYPFKSPWASIQDGLICGVIGYIYTVLTSQFDLVSSFFCIARRISLKFHMLTSSFDVSSFSELKTKGHIFQDPDVRPPYTYANLIRQGILDSANGELTLNDIYNWFMKHFAYFRKNTSTWKVSLYCFSIFHSLGSFLGTSNYCSGPGSSNNNNNNK